MAYTLKWRDQNAKGTIEVPVGAILPGKADIVFTGKGASNYGVVQQENLMRLLEHFAGGTPPENPTVGELWYDTSNKVLKLCVEKTPTQTIWRSLAGIQVTNAQNNEEPPTNPSLGDLWFEKTGSLSGVLYVYTGLGRYPSTSTAIIGGWDQIWPNVTLVAGREEYDAALELVKSLLGPTTGGGNGAIGKILALNDLSRLDNELRSIYQTSAKDLNVLAPASEDPSALRVGPNSQDWDLLLAAARYAVSRLELPVGYEQDISPVPFVADGRPVHPDLLSLPTSDVRYPTIERRANRNYSLMTLSRLFTETMNVLTAAVNNRYSLKGINGQTGTNPDLVSPVQLSAHSTFSGAISSPTTSLSLTFKFNSKEERDSFLMSGGAIQLVASAPTGTSVGTQSARSLFENKGTLRFTFDKTRVFTAALPLSLAEAPTQKGIKDGIAAGAAGTVLTTQTAAGGAATYTIRASSRNDTSFIIRFDLSVSGTTDGTLNLAFSVIHDTSVYGNPSSPVFGAPLAFQSGDSEGSLTPV